MLRIFWVITYLANVDQLDTVTGQPEGASRKCDPLTTKLEDAVTGQQEMVLVPRVPTPKMLEAAWAYALDEDVAGVWNAMLRQHESSSLAGLETRPREAPLNSVAGEQGTVS